MAPQTKIVLQIDPHDLEVYTKWAGSQHVAIEAIKRTALGSIRRRARDLDGTRAREQEQARLAEQIEEEKS